MIQLLKANPAWCAERFDRFAATWNIPPNADALKMFLACGLDTAMHKTDTKEIDDDQWEEFCAAVTQAHQDLHASSKPGGG